MAEKINLGWLKDYQNQKFAPKTFANQVLNLDGTSYESTVNQRFEDIAALIEAFNNIKYAGSDTPGGSALSAEKLTTQTVGYSDTPVYFKDGKPEICTSLSLNTSGSARQLEVEGTIAVDLTSNGTAPVYTKGGNIRPGVIGTLPIRSGGTGGTTVPLAQTNLELDELIQPSIIPATYAKFNSFNTNFMSSLMDCGVHDEVYRFVTTNSGSSVKLNESITTSSFDLSGGISLDIAWCGSYFIAVKSTNRAGTGIIQHRWFTFTIYKSTDGVNWTQVWSNEFEKGLMGHNQQQAGVFYDAANQQCRVVGVNGAGNFITISSSSGDAGTWTTKTFNVSIGDYGCVAGCRSYGQTIVTFYNDTVNDNDGYFYSTDGGLTWGLIPNSIGFKATSTKNMVYSDGVYYATTGGTTLYYNTSLGSGSWGTTTLTAEDESSFPTINQYTQIFRLNDQQFIINGLNYWYICEKNGSDNALSYRRYYHPLHLDNYQSVYLPLEQRVIFYNGNKEYSTYILDILTNDTLNITNATQQLITLKKMDKTDMVRSILNFPTTHQGHYQGSGVAGNNQSTIIPLPRNFQPYQVSISSPTNVYIFHLQGYPNQNGINVWHDVATQSICLYDPNGNVDAQLNNSDYIYYYSIEGTYKTEEQEYYGLPTPIKVNSIYTNNYVNLKNITWKDYLFTFGTTTGTGEIKFEDFAHSKGFVLYNNNKLKHENGNYVTIFDTITQENYTY